MRPAFSIIFLTTLIGAGQGLFLVLYATEMLHLEAAPSFYLTGGILVLLSCLLGLLASFFHLGHPSRSWRAIHMWRTSWLSREVLALMAFIGSAALYLVAHWMEMDAAWVVGSVAAAFSVALFVCTGMVYAAIKVMKEWATPLTVVNFLLMGCASGATLASALAAVSTPSLAPPLARVAALLTLLALLGRLTSLRRNARLKPDTTLQSALGIRHPRIAQKAQGAMGGTFNTREFFHGKSPDFLRLIKPAFLLLAFLVPLLLLAPGPSLPALSGLAFVLQYCGLLAERWFFFAEARHPQNLYYQTIS